MRIKIFNNSKWPLPKYETPESAGCDLRANIEAPVTIRPMSGAFFPTGVHIELTKGYKADVRGRSGLNVKHGIICPVGTVDSDYRGDIGVKLYNLGEEPFTINPGDRIAQLVITSVTQVEWDVVDSLEELNTTERGVGGFGHTGLK